jgi:hypothetical protein
MLPKWCQIQCTSPRVHYVNCGPGYIQCNNSFSFSGFNIQLRASALILDMSRQFSERLTANLVPIQRVTSSLRNVNSGPGHIHCKYNSAYSGINIQLNVSALILEICRQFNAPYNAIFVPNTAHILQITLCGLWSRTYTM